MEIKKVFTCADPECSTLTRFIAISILLFYSDLIKCSILSNATCRFSIEYA